MSENFDFDEHEGERPAAPMSGLAGLRAMREDITKERRLDIPRETSVGHLFVRFAPISNAIVNRMADEVEKKKKNPDATADANAQILVSSCRGVFARNEDGEEWEWEGFNLKLAQELLGKDIRDARQICREFYGRGQEGDGIVAGVIATLMKWSGYTENAAVEEYEGN